MADEGEILPPDSNIGSSGTRAPGGLIPQRHGGAILPPFGPGNGVGKGASARGVSMRAAKKRMREMMLDASEVNLTALLEICRGDDRRAAVVALKEYYDRFLGKSNEHGFGRDDDTGALDLSTLSKEHQDEVICLLARLREITGIDVGGEE